MKHANLVQRVNGARQHSPLLEQEVADYLNPPFEFSGEPFGSVRAMERRDVFLRSINPDTCPQSLLRLIVNLTLPFKNSILRPTLEKLEQHLVLR